MDAAPASRVAESELVWAVQVAQRLLEPLGARWQHTLGVAKQAEAVGRALNPDQAVVLLAAAYLHDVGYAVDLVRTGFHALDGARFVRSAGHERLAGLVAYHSGATAEAGERGLAVELAGFQDERSLVSQALTYCDLTTDQEGRRVEPLDRLAEIRRRYDNSTPERRALERSEAVLLEDVRVIELALAQTGGSDPAPVRTELEDER